MPRTCSSCATSLENSQYYLRNGHSYCISCYEIRFSPTCTKCHQKIKGEQKSLTWTNTTWHNSCFNCTQCNKSLLVSSLLPSKNNLPYCSDCYDMKFSPKCNECGDIIEFGTSYMEINGNKLHKHCFKCFYCKVSLNDQYYYDHNGASYCQKCDNKQFGPKCARCNAVIPRGTRYTRVDGEIMHNTCFTCFACGQVIVGQYQTRNRHNYHSYCVDDSYVREKTSYQEPEHNNHTSQRQDNHSHRSPKNTRRTRTDRRSTVSPLNPRSLSAISSRPPSSSSKPSDLSNNRTESHFSQETAPNILLNFTPQTPKHAQNSTPSDVSVISDFYNACRDNNIDLVIKKLETMSVKEINKIEANGSTALHVASYRGHEKIVELLLEKGASHSIVNRYNNTPLVEAKTERIKKLISGRMNSNTRFGSESVEWILSTDDADFQANEYLKKLETYGKDPNFDRLIIHIKEYYLEKLLKSVEDIQKIKKYFDRAIKKKDPVHLLVAYTADTGFYSALNVDLAKLRLENLTDNENLDRAYYTGIIAHHPKLERFSFTGTVFRGMIITNDDLKQYVKGKRILTKTFSSASKERNIALGFFNNDLDRNNRLNTICIYQIRNERTALDIQEISEFTYEQEVLILPYSAFKIIDIQKNNHNSPHIEITLKECEPW